MTKTEFYEKHYSSNGLVAWRNLGMGFPEPVSPMEALVQAGLNWTVEKWPNFAQGLFTFHRCPASYSTVRLDAMKDETLKPTVFGAVGRQFQVVQNRRAAEFVDALVAQGVEIHRAGDFLGGRRVWFIGRLGRTFNVGESDEYDCNVVVCNSHDGSMSFVCGLSAIRLASGVSWWAQPKKGEKFIRLRHSGDMDTRLSEAREVLDVAVQAFEARRKAFESLLDTPMLANQALEGFELLVPDPEEPASPNRARKARERLINIYQNSDTVNMKGCGGTAYAFVNTVAEWVETQRGLTISEDRRVNALWFGSGDALKNQAINVVHTLT